MNGRRVAQHKPGTWMTIGGPGIGRPVLRPRGLAGLLGGISASAAALALSFAPQQAHAQRAVNADVTGASNAVVNRAANFDQVDVLSSQATVDWTLDSTGVSTGVFLDGAGTLAFSGSGAYTVLNRVNPLTLSDTLQINGAVTSTPGGRIWFYNPNGWVVGGGATLDVGSLVLTSLSIVEDTFDGDLPFTSGLYGADGAIRFGQAPVPGSKVIVSPGAQIRAQQSGSYVALVAPRIEQRGFVSTYGSSAYVAAEKVDITINSGLFDIVVTSGTSDSNGIVHTGTTDGQQGLGGNQVQYLAAVPKNDAMTMLVSGNLGYSTASSAGFENGRIVLSAGNSIVAGEFQPASAAPASIAIKDALFRNGTEGRATETIALDATGVESGIAVFGDLSLYAGNRETGGTITLDVGAGGGFSVDGNFTAQADGVGAIVTDPENGDVLAGGVAGANATGGSVKIDVADGFYRVGGTTVLTADARGGLGGASAGSARAGAVSLTVGAAAEFQSDASGDIFASASAGTQSFGAGPDTGASGTGGTVSLSLAKGFTTNALTVRADAVASPGTDAKPKDATAGAAQVTFVGDAFTVGQFQVSTSASASDGGVANGTGLANQLALTIDNAQLTVDNFAILSEERSGNPGTSGGIALTVSNAGAFVLNPETGADLRIVSRASNPVSGEVRGSPVSVVLDGGSLSGRFIDISSEGAGASFGTNAATSGRGGDVSLAIRNGGSLSAQFLSVASIGSGGFADDAGDGFGGTASISVGAGTLDSTFVDLVAAGGAGRQFSGDGRVGTGTGGTVTMTVNDAAAVVNVNSLRVAAPGGPGFGRVPTLAADVSALGSGPGSGGNGIGGTAALNLLAGNITAVDAEVSADGDGGRGFNDEVTAALGVGGRGGDGEGGSATLLVDGATASIQSISVLANGRGGEGASASSFFGAPAGAGGNGNGGAATLTLSGGTLTTAAIEVDASGNRPEILPFGEGIFFEYFGTGGSNFENDGESAGKGGLGEGGTAAFSMTGGALVNSTDGPLGIDIRSIGYGGNGGDTGEGFILVDGVAAFAALAATDKTRGSGADGIGGTASFSILGGDADFTNAFVSADGIGGEAGEEFDGVARTTGNGGSGGSGFGGNATIVVGTALAATDSFGNTRSFVAGAGGFGASGGEGIIAGNGGAGQGGTARFVGTAPDLAIGNLFVSAVGSGANGGNAGEGNDGGAGGAGTGGTAEIVAEGSGAALTLRDGSLNAGGFGGRGGDGGYGTSTLDAAGNGGVGAAGTGGVAALIARDGATLDYSAISEFGVFVDGQGGNGGDGGDASQFFEGAQAIGDGGAAGAGRGGTLALSALDGVLVLGDASFSAGGVGGFGGGRISNEPISTDASRGGDGAAGFGGAIVLTASGANGSLQAGSLTLQANGTGGDGASGVGFDPATFAGAAGGKGEAGTGGTITLDALNGGTIALGPENSSFFYANGTAGTGGSGADGSTDPVTGAGGAGGAGGNSGQGSGGAITLNTAGGLISGGDLNLFVNGAGRLGQNGGTGGTGQVPAGAPEGTPAGPNGAAGEAGVGGFGVGGTIALIATNDEGGRAGGLDLGAVTLDVTATIGNGDSSFLDVAGAASIRDEVDESNGGVRFGSLTVRGQGSDIFNPVALTIASSDQPIRVADFVDASTAGSIEVTAAGTGGLDVTGLLTLDSGRDILLSSSGGGLIRAGDIQLFAGGTVAVSAADCDGPLCPAVFADNGFRSFSGGGFALAGPAQVGAGGFIDIYSFGEVGGDAGSGYRAPSMTIAGAGDVTIANATGGSLRADAGLNQGEGSFFAEGSLTLGQAGGGTIDLAGSLFAQAGTDVVVAEATAIAAMDSLQIVAGDDILIGAGARLTNATGGSEPGSLLLDAGGLANFAEPVAGNVASLILGSGATIDGTGGDATLIGEAIDGRSADLRGRNVLADVRNPPAPGVAQGDDAGQLTAPCLQGDICLGGITAIGAVQIGQGRSAPVRFTGSGDIAGASVAITSRDTLTYGSAAAPFTIISDGLIALTSQAGDVAFAGNALLEGGTIALTAAGSVSGNGRLLSADDIGIDVGSSIALASLIAGGQLTTVAGIGAPPEAQYALPGNLAIGTLQVGTDQAIAAGGAIVIGNASAARNNLVLRAGTRASLGASSAIGDLALAGQTIEFGTITAAGAISLAAAGAISGGSAVAGGILSADGATLTADTLRSGGASALTTSGAMTLGSATSGAGLAIDAGDLSFGSLTSTGATGIVASTVSGGDIAAGTSLDITSPGAIGLGTAIAGTTLALDGATLAATTLRSGQDMTLASTGATTLGTATSGAGLGIDAGDLSFGSLTSTGATGIAAGTVSGGDIAAGTSLDVTSPGAIFLGAATAGTTLALDGATLTATTLRSGQDMTLASTGATTLGTATSGAGLAIDAGDLSFGSLTSTGATALAASAVAGGDIAAGTSLDVTSSGAILLGAATAGTTLALDGGSIAATDLQSGQATALASSGATTIGSATAGAEFASNSASLQFGAITAAGDIALSTGTATGGNATSTGGAIDLVASGPATVGALSAASDLTATTAELAFASLTAGGAVSASAGSIAGGDVGAGSAVALAATNALAIGKAMAGTTLALEAASIAATNLQSGGGVTLASTGETAIGTATSGEGFTSTSGALTFAGITAAGDIRLTTGSAKGGDATSTAGAIVLSSAGAASVGQLKAATDITGRATTLGFAGMTSGRDTVLDVTSLGGTAIAAGRDLTIRSVNDLAFGSIAAVRNLSLSASQGAITINTDIDAGGAIALAGDAILVKAAGPLSIASASADNGDIGITTDGLLTVSSATSRGDIALTSTANSLVLGPLVAGRTPQSAQAINAGGTSKGTPGPGAITLSAAQAITMQGAVDALTTLSATAGTLIDQRALAVGKTIAYRSADLALGQGAALGQSNFTTGIALTNGGTGGALLGDGTGTASGYRIDAAEFGRIHSGGDLSLAAGSSLSVGTLAANAATGSGGTADGNLGATGMLSLTTSGELAVGGALALGNAAGNTLRLNGGTVSVDAATGSVRLVEGSGRGGTLAVNAGEVLALTAAARAAVAGLDANGTNLRLAQNDGVTDGRTLLEAGAITLSVPGRLLIQNTALGQSFDQRRGFVADSFAIATAGTSSQRGGAPLIVINGTVGGLTGLNALRAVQVSGGFDEFSTVNGCTLLTASCGIAQFDPIRGLLEEEDIGEGSTLGGSDGGFGTQPLIQILRFEPVGFEAVIDEPVTGSGNDDFLAPEAGTDADQCTSEDRTKCDKPPGG